jgi:hypothetical protein
MDYKVTLQEYLRILSYVYSMHKESLFVCTQRLLFDLLEINSRQSGDTYIIPERIMRRVAVANLCDMCLIQYRDSNGEIDYAGLGSNTIEVVKAILQSI